MKTEVKLIVLLKALAAGCAMAGLFLLAGCASIPFKREVHKLKFTLIMDSHENINKAYRGWCETLGKPYKEVDGFRAFGRIFCPVGGYDKNGEAYPAFHTFGHEAWHTVKDDYHN